MIFPHRPYLRYTSVVALVACALTANYFLSSFVEPDYLVTFLTVVLLSAWFGGRMAGFLAAGLTAAALLMPFETGSTARFATYLLSAVVFAYLAGELRLMSSRWEATLCSIGDGVVVIDRQGYVRFLNPAAEAMTGWTARDAKKKRMEEVVRLTDETAGELLSSPLTALLEEGQTFRATRPKRLVSRDGHEVWVEESSAPIRNEGNAVVGAILLFRDVTARQELQDQVNQSQRMDAIGRLASGVAGDFNDLLTVMTGYSEMLRSDLEAGDHRQRFADEIYLAADRAAGLTRQLTALGNRVPGSMKVLDLSALISSMETMLRRLLGGQIDLTIVGGSGKVRADASQIEQVLVNLAMNSRDAMPQGGKFVIEIGNAEIDSTQIDKWPGVKPGSYVTLAVSDTGSGMDAETRSHLFEPFFTTKPKEKGAGMGLSIVYGIIQQNRGFINVFSQVGAGTIFEIFLPRDKGTGEIMLPTATPRNKRGSETVLIADDEEGIRKLVHAVLATNGYKVLEASDGLEGLAVYTANRAKVDIVVTDVKMPKMDGLELGARLRVLDPSLCVLYMSGYMAGGAAEEQRDRAFLYKPFTPDALLTQVRELLDGQTAGPAPKPNQ